MSETIEVRESGVEILEELEGGEGETAFLVRLPKTIDPELGESAGVPIRALGVTHAIVVEVDVPVDEMTKAIMEAQGEQAPERIQQGVIAISNEDGDAGHALVQREGADLEEMFEALETELLA